VKFLSMPVEHGGVPPPEPEEQPEQQAPVPEQAAGRAFERHSGQPPPERQQADAESFQVWAEHQDTRATHLTSEWWPKATLERTRWSNLVEYLLAKSNLVPETPHQWPLEDDELWLQLEERRRQKIKAIVQEWRRRGLL
jgi:hypothetical protein